MCEFRVAFVDLFSLCRRAHVSDRPFAKHKANENLLYLWMLLVVANYDANTVVTCNTFSISVRINPK